MTQRLKCPQGHEWEVALLSSGTAAARLTVPLAEGSSGPASGETRHPAVADDGERLVEVKATAWGKFFPFYVTDIELRSSEAMAQQFHLFRVFDFIRSPRLFVLRGSLREACNLEPTLFRATL